MSEYMKKAVIWLCLSIAAEIIILTDALIVWFTAHITSDITMRAIISFPLIYLFWILGIWVLHTFYKRKPTIHFSYKEKPTIKHVSLGLLLLVISTTMLYFSWDGLKIYKELIGSINYAGFGLGLASFFAQHIYYFIETILITLIIAFAQEAGETFFKPRWIPYGGIGLVFLWGIVHIAWHGVTDGLVTIMLAPLYGVAFLVMRKNIKYAILLIYLMFVL